MLHNITVVTLNYYIPDRWEMQEEMINFSFYSEQGKGFIIVVEIAVLLCYDKMDRRGGRKNGKKFRIKIPG